MVVRVVKPNAAWSRGVVTQVLGYPGRLSIRIQSRICVKDYPASPRLCLPHLETRDSFEG